MESVYVLKIGGELLRDATKLESLLQYFIQIESPKILVHGGGRDATELSQSMGIEPQMIDGRRVTDRAQLEIACMVYAGKVNTQLVATLGAKGVQSLGINGGDLGWIRCEKRPASPIDFGYVGDVKEVRPEKLMGLLALGVCPVISAITVDDKGQLLNTNADTIATETAKALSPYGTVTLALLMGPSGILGDIQDPSSRIPLLSKSKYLQLKQHGALSGGILPKLQNGFNALENGVHRVIVANEESIINQNNTQLCL